MTIIICRLLTPLFSYRKSLKQTVAPKSSWSRGCVQKQPTACRLCPLSLAQAAKVYGVPASASTRIEGLVFPAGKPHVIPGIVWATLEITDGVHDGYLALCFFQVPFQALIVHRQNCDKKRHAGCYLRQRLHPWDTFVLRYNLLRIKLEGLSTGLRETVLRILYSPAFFLSFYLFLHSFLKQDQIMPIK